MSLILQALIPFVNYEELFKRKESDYNYRIIDYATGRYRWGGRQHKQLRDFGWWDCLSQELLPRGTCKSQGEAGKSGIREWRDYH